MKIKKLNGHIEQIVNGYKKEYDRYRQLLSLSEQLREILRSPEGAGQLDAVSELLQRRAGVIDDIQRIEADMAANQEQIQKILHLKTFDLAKVQELIFPHLREQMEEERRKLRILVSQIIETDSDNGARMETLKGDVVAELKKIHRHFELQQAYLDRSEQFSESRFFDHKK